jgi:hypothetical protein
MVKPNRAAVPLRGELKPREGVHRHRIGLDGPHVAQQLGSGVLGEETADTRAEPREVAPRDRSIHGEVGGACHRPLDGAAAECSSPPMSLRVNTV